MNRLLLFAELILDYWGGGKGLSCRPPFPFPPPPGKKKRAQEKEKGNRAGMCRVPGAGWERGGGVVGVFLLLLLFKKKKKKLGKGERAGQEDARSGATEQQRERGRWRLQ